MCLDLLMPAITQIINKSLTTGSVPDIYKKAIVKPLIKKKNLDREDLKNYRPISNLCFLSKILEKIVLKRISKHLRENDLWEEFQSAYRRHHSTETALCCVANDLLEILDRRSISLLTLLDLSAAFDTIDHCILVDRLKITFGITGVALEWFISYLYNRSQEVSIMGRCSKANNLRFGVPQGSVLGPVLFILYTSPLSKIITRHGMSYHLYADDTQLLDPYSTDIVKTVRKTEDCVSDVKEWMDRNKLKMNEEKTEILLVGNSNKVKQHSSIEVKIGNDIIKTVNSVKNLGAYFDSGMKMSTHIGNLYRSLNCDLKRIRTIRPYISSKTCEKLVVSLIFSKLDYCNSLLVSLPKNALAPLQRFQNHAARLIFKKTKFEQATPLLHTLHWLPIEKRCLFKAACLVFKCTAGIAPSYLSRHVVPYKQECYGLRSMNDATKLVERRSKTNLGNRSFSRFGPKFWNTLPRGLRESGSFDSFKEKLKTYLFTLK